MNRRIATATATLGVAIAGLILLALAGAVRSDPTPPAPTSVTEAVCAMPNGDVLLHGRDGWMYLPDYTVNEMPADLDTCDPAAYATPVKAAFPEVEPTAILAEVLPYYGKVPPAWCAEDLPCWIGSKADGRTATEILAALPADLISSSQAYAYGDASDTAAQS